MNEVSYEPNKNHAGQKTRVQLGNAETYFYEIDIGHFFLDVSFLCIESKSPLKREV